MRSLAPAERAAVAESIASPDLERLRRAWLLGCTTIAAIGVITGAVGGTPFGSMTWMFVGKLEPRSA
jgi:hypothetical protein